MADIFNLADTWNDGATTFNAIKMNVTDTASAAGSSLMDLQVGGVSLFRVSKEGYATVPLGGPNSCSVNFGQLNSGFYSANGFDVGYSRAGAKTFYLGFNRASVGSSGYFGFASGASADGTIDLFLRRDAANTFALQNGINAQAQNIYNTYTDANNYERARMGWTANAYEIKPEAAGTGTVRVLHISGLPTSDPGTGILWNDAGTVKVGV